MFPVIIKSGALLDDKKFSKKKHTLPHTRTSPMDSPSHTSVLVSRSTRGRKHLLTETTPNRILSQCSKRTRERTRLQTNSTLNEVLPPCSRSTRGSVSKFYLHQVKCHRHLQEALQLLLMGLTAKFRKKEREKKLNLSNYYEAIQNLD